MTLSEEMRLAQLNEIEENFIRAAESGAVSMNIIWHGNDFDSVILSGVNPEIFPKQEYNDGGHYQ